MLGEDAYALSKKYTKKLYDELYNEIENIKNNVPSATVTVSYKGLTLNNEIKYNPATWAEWDPKGQATVEDGALVIDNNTAVVQPIIPANFKPSTKYGILINVPVNTRATAIGINSSSGGTRPFSSTLYVDVGESGDIKFVETTQSDVSKNEYGMSILQDSGRFELKGFRIFELPAGSQIEQDFDTLSADELAAKYPYVQDSLSTISAKRITSIADGTTEKAYIPYVGELKSDSTSADEILITNGKGDYIRRVGVDPPVVTPITITGKILAGEVFLEPITQVSDTYDGGISVEHTELPILSIESISKVGDPELDVNSAVIAGNRLSFTHPDIVNGDIVTFEYSYDKEGTKGTLQVTIDEPVTPSVRSVKKKLYSFGLVSDVHLKDVSVSPDFTHSLVDYEKALTYYKENGADFVCIPGDLVQSFSDPGRPEVEGEQQWLSELNIFKDYNSTYFDVGEVYFCVGNHDASTTGHVGGSLGNVVQSYEDGTKTGEQVYQEITGRPINYTFEKDNDVFIFFSMYSYEFADFCRPEDITWLSQQLETYKDKRVFLFAHVPLPNVFEPPHTNTLDLQPNSRALEFKNLLEGYTNVVWFSGHSHRDLTLEEQYSNSNVVIQDNMPVMVNCSSCSYPKTPDGSGGEISNYEGSQGYIVDVYEDEIVLNGIDFTVGTNGLAIPVAHYII